MNTSIVTPIIAIYGAVVSTLSAILALKVFLAGKPDVDLGWEYHGPSRNLALMVFNTERADVTISTIELYIVRHVVIRRSPISNAFAIRRETIDQIPSELWRNDVPISFRVASYSQVDISVSSDAIKLPPELPFDEMLLKFVARYPSGKQTAHVRGEILRHFLGIDPDRPITPPLRGAVPAED